MPFCPNKTVYCITQLLKCLFGTNMINQYNDFMSIADNEMLPVKTSFYRNVMLVNPVSCREDSGRSSICSNTSQKLSLDTKNPKMMEERQMLIALENFSKNKTDRKWSTNKKELERYIRLFEPVVIQALKVRILFLYRFEDKSICFVYTQIKNNNITIIQVPSTGQHEYVCFCGFHLSNQFTTVVILFPELHDAERHPAAACGTGAVRPATGIAC